MSKSTQEASQDMNDLEKLSPDKSQESTALAKESPDKKSTENTSSSDQEALVNDFLAANPHTFANATLNHGRSLPLPMRVKTGSFGKENLRVETAKDRFEIPWEKVRLVCLGFVAEKYDTEKSAYMTEKMVADMGRFIAGGSQEDSKIVSFKESHVLDVVVDGFAEPLRFESNNLNYRAFLGRVSFVSFQNFFKFVRELVSHCKQAHFNKNVKHFLAWQRFELQKCAAFHEHDEYVAQRMEDPSDMLVFADLDLSRTSWAQEWTD